MSARNDGEDRLRAGRGELRLAVAATAGPSGPAEDAVVDAARLQVAFEHFAAAASLFSAGGSPGDEVRARIALGEAYLRMPLDDESCAAAEASGRAALALLDTADDPATSLEGYLLLAEAMTPLICHALQGPDKENRIDRAIGLLGAAEFLADRQTDPLALARVRDHASRLLGERFRGDRDANLLDAIRAGERALPTFRERHADAPARYPSLQVHLGNCYLKLAGPRPRWLEEGLAAYRDGLAVVDAQRWPRLHRILAENVTLAETLIAQGDALLPQKEMMGRFGARLQVALDVGDWTAAEGAAWETMRWAWSLHQAPNVWVGEAHKIIGTLLLHRNETREAQKHFYSAVVVLSAIAQLGDPQQAALLEGAKQRLADVMGRLGRAERISELLQQASWAYSAARGHCDRGTRPLATEPKAALDAFEQALALFPHDPSALFYRGAAASALGDRDAARRDFDAAIDLCPRHVAALIFRADLRLQGDDTEGALADYAAVLEVDAGNVMALYNRASLRAAQGDCEAAVADLDRLVAAHPEVKAAYVLRADCLARLGQREKAAGDLTA